MFNLHCYLQLQCITIWITLALFSLLSAAAAAKSLQSFLTLCDPIDASPPGSPVPGILQARTLEWVAISFSNAWKWKVKVKSFSRVWLFVTPWTAAYQAPPSMGFSRQEYWSGVPLPSPLSLIYDLLLQQWENWLQVSAIHYLIVQFQCVCVCGHVYVHTYMVCIFVHVCVYWLQSG